uniref:Uncharacterized protein n=1 Tax=Sphaerodactylus townsendi TaxID=933632 RepID=A0ACB8E853_9SAUR
MRARGQEVKSTANRPKRSGRRGVAAAAGPGGEREDQTMDGSCHPQQLQEEAVEAWLDDHGDFARSYFVKKATRTVR